MAFISPTLIGGRPPKNKNPELEPGSKTKARIDSYFSPGFQAAGGQGKTGGGREGKKKMRQEPPPESSSSSGVIIKQFLEHDMIQHVASSPSWSTFATALLI